MKAHSDPEVVMRFAFLSLAGLLAGLTRPVGILLMAPVFVAAVRSGPRFLYRLDPLVLPMPQLKDGLFFIRSRRRGRRRSPRPPRSRR